MPQTTVRVAGSGFTTLKFNGKDIAYLDGFTDQGQQPVKGPEAIISLGDRHAREIATSRTLDMGVLTATIRELWNGPVWQSLSLLAAANDLIDVYEALAFSDQEVTCQMIIKPPGSSVWRGKQYHNCVVTGIDDTESVAITTLSVARQIQISYTHTTPTFQNANT